MPLYFNLSCVKIYFLEVIQKLLVYLTIGASVFKSVWLMNINNENYLNLLNKKYKIQTNCNNLSYILNDTYILICTNDYNWKRNYKKNNKDSKIFPIPFKLRKNYLFARLKKKKYLELSVNPFRIREHLGETNWMLMYEHDSLDDAFDMMH